MLFIFSFIDKLLSLKWVRQWHRRILRALGCFPLLA
nr:MAG TPA: hypothetical protein [Caudoviricetes sp.]